MTTRTDYHAEVLADSIAEGVRLTTIEVTFPRIVLAEFNTHRMLCLAGDMELEFDLPAGARNSKHRVHRMRLDEFVDKWLYGARRVAANPKRATDLSWIEDAQEYTSHEVAARIGMANASNIHRLCRAGGIPARRGLDNRTWLLRGSDVRAWRLAVPEHTRFDMRAKLAAMKIRQLNESTGDIQWSHVTAAGASGRKIVYEVRAGEFIVAGSVDHRVLTTDGWRTIGELQPGVDMLVVRKFGKHDDDRLDPMRLRKIDGVWRSQWQRKVAAEMRAEDPLCRRCRAATAEQIHHVVPVYEEPARALDRTNVTFLCESCHRVQHAEQDWQGGTYLYGAAVTVDEVVKRGMEETYDLTIAGDFPNFLANGVVVHNSRNSASSRAIPVEKRIKTVREHPFVPRAFGKNQKGMQASEELSDHDTEFARATWLGARDAAVAEANNLASIGVHKQLANRLLEPFCWHTVICTATEWTNFFALRCHPDAQPEIRIAAELMREAMEKSVPAEKREYEWHLPLVYAQDLLDPYVREKDPPWISAARCARVSYLTHDGKRDVEADLALAKRLKTSGHMSPFEHPARVDAEYVVGDPGPRHGTDTRQFVGNFRWPWVQLRKTIAGENVFRPEGA